MANRDAISGARLHGHLQGGSFNARIRPYVVLATDGTALYVGDFVKLTGTGGTSDYDQTLPGVTQAAATETLVGFVVGFAPNSSYLNQIYRTASTLRTVFVCDDPYALFEIQTSGTAAVTDLGANADIVVGTPSTVFGTSGMELDQSSVTTSTAQLRIYALEQRPDNVMGLNAKLTCFINEHQYKTTSGS